jgi:hypothetical protein
MIGFDIHLQSGEMECASIFAQIVGAATLDINKQTLHVSAMFSADDISRFAAELKSYPTAESLLEKLCSAQHASLLSYSDGDLDAWIHRVLFELDALPLILPSYIESIEQPILLVFDSFPAIRERLQEACKRAVLQFDLMRSVLPPFVACALVRLIGWMSLVSLTPTLINGLAQGSWTKLFDETGESLETAAYRSLAGLAADQSCQTQLQRGLLNSYAAVPCFIGLAGLYDERVTSWFLIAAATLARDKSAVPSLRYLISVFLKITNGSHDEVTAAVIRPLLSTYDSANVTIIQEFLRELLWETDSPPLRCLANRDSHGALLDLCFEVLPVSVLKSPIRIPIPAHWHETVTLIKEPLDETMIADFPAVPVRQPE